MIEKVQLYQKSTFLVERYFELIVQIKTMNGFRQWFQYNYINRYASSGIFRFLWKIRIAAHKTTEEPSESARRSKSLF